MAYDLHAPELSELARRALGDADLSRGYLRAWGTHVDSNFPSALRKLGIELGPSRNGTPR